MAADIVLIDKTDGLDPSLDQPRAERRVEGAPWRKTWLLHESGPVSAGVWECEVVRPVRKQFVVVETC